MTNFHFDIVASGGLGVGQLNDISRILPQPTLLALATKIVEWDKNRLQLEPRTKN